MRKGLFLDRDGTLIVDTGYLSNPDDVSLLPNASLALKKALEKGYDLFLFTNQSGVGRGYFTLDSVDACNQRMFELLGVPSTIFREICIAPEHPDHPPIYRKPSPRFILETVKKYGLDTTTTYMIGDRWSDTKAALSANIQAIRVETGEPITAIEKEWLEKGMIQSAPTILDAIRLL